MPLPTLDALVGDTPLAKLQRLPGNAACIRKWPAEYVPKIYDSQRVDRLVEMRAGSTEWTTLEPSRQQGISEGISCAGAVSVALEKSRELTDAVIVTLICGRGDRYLSRALFNKE